SLSESAGAFIMQLSGNKQTGAVIPSARIGAWSRKRVMHLVNNGIWYIILTFFALVLALPLIWLASTSLKTGPQTFLMPPMWIPDPVVWENYPQAFQAVPFQQYFWNTLQIVVFATLGTLLTSS